MLDLARLKPEDRDAEDLFRHHQDPRVRELWAEAESEALRLELASDDVTRSKVRARLGTLGEAAVLIGGPPCQAYSIAGRVRPPAPGFPGGGMAASNWVS
jgi:site-specific DNA-cytosine methylase